MSDSSPVGPVLQRRIGRLVSRFGPALLFAAVAAAAIGSMYRGHQLVWGNDANWPLDLRELPRYTQIIDGTLSAPDVRKLPMLLPQGTFLLAWKALALPYDPGVAQRIFLWGLMLAAGLSAMWMLRTLLPRLRRSAVIAGALFYMLNLYAITTIWTPLSNLLFHYAFFPLVFGLWHKALKSRSWLRALFAASVWAVAITPAYGATPVAATDLTMLLGLVVMHLVRSRGARKAVLGSAMLMLAAWSVFSVFWTLPIVEYAGAVNTRGLSTGDPRRLYRLNSVPMTQAVRLGGYVGLWGDYKDSPYIPWGRYYEEGPGGHLSWSVPLIALTGIATRARRRRSSARDDDETLWPVHDDPPIRDENNRDERANLIFFGAVLLGALILVTGPNWPFGSTKLWLMSIAESFGPFRSSYQRFMMYVAFAYVPFIALGTSALADLASRRARRQQTTPSDSMWGFSVAVAILLGVLVVAPLWTTTYTERSGIIPARRTNVPDELYRVASWVSKQRGDFNVAVLPTAPGLRQALKWSDGNAGYVGVEPMTLMLSKPLAYPDPAVPHIEHLLSQIADAGPSTVPALRLLNLRYVIVHKQVHAEYSSGLPDLIASDTRAFRERTDRAGYLRRVFDGEHLTVYENPDWIPFRVFAATEPGRENIHRRPASTIRPLGYRVTGPGRYEVDGGDLRPGEVIVVNTPHDPRWSASGRRPIGASTGVVAIRGPFPDGTVVIEHSLQKRMPLLLAVIPLSFGSLLFTGRALGRGSRRLRRGSSKGRGRNGCLVLTPSTKFGSWSYFHKVIAASPDLDWTVVSFGKPGVRHGNTRFFSLPQIDYTKIGARISTRGFSGLGLLLYVPLVPVIIVAALVRRPRTYMGNGIAATAMLWPLAKLSGARLILSYHGYAGHVGTTVQRVLRRLLPKCDAAFVNSETSLDDVARFMPRERIFVLSHWATKPFFAAPVERPSNRPLRVLFVGRLDEEKFTQCLRVCEPLAAEGSVELWAAGTGVLAESMKDKPGLRWLGYVSDPVELASLYAQCDIVWAPADTTYYAIPGAEGLASACPLIISDVPAVTSRVAEGHRIPRDLIPPHVGRVVDGADDAEAKAFLRRLSREGIPVWTRRAAREYAEEHHSERKLQPLLDRLRSG